VRFAAVEAARPIEDLAQRLRALCADNDRAGQFVWQLFRDFFLYTVRMIPEISDRIVEIDRAMRWGFAFAKGPFELWDALGVSDTVARMQREGCEIPASIERMMQHGARGFYEPADRDGSPGTRYYDLLSGEHRDLDSRPGVTMLHEIKRARGVVHSNPGASLVDIGDGALCLEFHSKMNSLGEDAVQMIYAALDELNRNYQALVIANDGDNFSVGANLMMVLLAAQESEWDQLDRAVRRFQQAGMALKYAPRPVVSAPFGMALGGGCEVAMAAGRIQAAAETYMGLVETGVGLIPAGGGCKEMLIRLRDAKRAFEVIGYGKISESAEHARTLGFLSAADNISMNRERLLEDAKAVALSLTSSWAPGLRSTDIPVEGEAGYALLKMGVYLAHEGAYLTDYDTIVGEKLAHILSGGRGLKRNVTEQHLLDLEREAFLSLCGNAKTQERMQYMLKNGKPLRN
jgi:3-hydroxyacyl-CoA dehydrogenase